MINTNTIQAILDKRMPRIDLDPTKPMILAGCTKSTHDMMKANIAEFDSLLTSSDMKSDSPEFRSLLINRWVKSYMGKISPACVINVVDDLLAEVNRSPFDREFGKEYISYMLAYLSNPRLESLIIELESNFNETEIDDMKLVVRDLQRMRADMNDRMTKLHNRSTNNPE